MVDGQRCGSLVRTEKTAVQEGPGAMDQELIAFLDQRFRESNQQIASLREQITEFREEMTHRLEGVEETIRHTRVEIEGLRSQIRLLAEGMINFDERLASFRGEVKRDLDSIRGLFFPLHEALQDRVHNLESWRQSKERDPIEIIKERYGPQARQSQTG